ncbi:RCC1 domain-containing protein [Herbidospora mongoliensis]|uniref:RCC1 domain-containing protein n=1 Tax=Herbidospora mongoliensis TaxID=688067 RepID=UPI001470EAC2|nr:RCC1 domain-containing protein [Herbidospora mongoliensis]
MRLRLVAVAVTLALTAAMAGTALASGGVDAQVTAVEFWGWGLNAEGQIGDGGTVDRRFPLLVGGLPGDPDGEGVIRQIVTGSTFSGGVDSTGSVFLWGSLPGVVNSPSPVRVNGLPRSSPSASATDTCSPVPPTAPSGRGATTPSASSVTAPRPAGRCPARSPA